MKQNTNKSRNDFVLTFMDILTAPILTHSPAWADTMPDRLRKVVKMERTIQQMKGREYAGDAECVAYLYTYTLDAPPSRDWAEIYLHLSCKVMEQHFGLDKWEEVRAIRALDDHQDKYLLQPLRNWIYRKRREIVKARLKDTPDMPDTANQMVLEDILGDIEKKAEEYKENGKSINNHKTTKETDHVDTITQTDRQHKSKLQEL